MSIRSTVLIVLWAGIITAQENQVSIAFSDLVLLVEKSSPQSKILHTEYEAIKAENDIELQWSNPELNYTLEQVEFDGLKETEQIIDLSKSFDFPINYYKQRNIREYANQSAEYNLYQNKNDLLATIKTDYVYLSLLQNLSILLDKYSKTLMDLNLALRAQKEEGALSKIDADLLAMNLFNFESEELQIKLEFQNKKNHWATVVGFDVDTEFNFADSIQYVDITFNDIDKEYLLRNHLGFQARQKRLEVLNQRISLEKWRIIPSFFLHGGYKKVDPQWEGFVIGVSLPLPLLNQNSLQIEKQNYEYRIYENKTLIYKYNLQSQINNIITVIIAKSELFKKHRQNEIPVENLIAAFREGIWSLTDLLNAIEMMRDNKLKYIKQLTSYYQAVFELESISGQQLVSF